nr:hypothetical protein [Sicyoidochytrium minutum DNA virus]
MTKEGKWVTPGELLNLLKNAGYIIWYKQPEDQHLILHARSRDFTDTKFVRAKVSLSALDPYLEFDEA